MTKTRAKWTAFPFGDKAYDYGGPALRKHWPRLHQGDREPFPDLARLKSLVAAHPELEPLQSLEDTARLLQSAWRAYHRGDFGAASDLGLSAGPLGFNVANKACIIHATYLESDAERKLTRLSESAKRAEELQACDGTMPNAWYLHAQALGRYGQELSVARALAEGLGDKVKASLERTLALEPRHADAHIALGAYNAVVIHKLGETIGRLTYGASKKSGIEEFETALALNPQSAIAHIEYANGLVMMFGKARLAEATRLYEAAAACAPADAMERLDVELARSELAE